MIKYPAALALAAALAVGACATSLAPTVVTTSGKTVVSAAKLGADAIQLGNTLNLVVAVDMTLTTPSTSADAVITTAATALIAAGQSIASSPAVSGDLSANVQLGTAAVQSLLAGYGSTSAQAGATVASVAAKIKAYDKVLVTLLAIYNTDASEYGLPTVTIPPI